jgi:hypothetical protein
MKILRNVKSYMNNKIKLWFSNLPTLFQRILAEYLKKRGWVVFFLVEDARFCTKDTCWLRVYLQNESRKNK